MLQAVIYYIVTVILTKELVIATDQCTKYQLETPFFPGVSCEDIYNKNSEIRDEPGYYWILDGPSNVYCGMNYTGSSCEDIYNNNPETCDKSGYYRINDNQWTYCNMTLITFANDTFICTCAGVGGGWRRIVNMNISAGDDCPGEWRNATLYGVRFCRVASDGFDTCSSANFSTNGISYQRVCGRARGYQKGHTNGFYGTHFNRSVDEDYVDGLSITHSSNPREHIWTFAIGYSETISSLWNCPCAVYPGISPLSVVGNNYYCESGSVHRPYYTYLYGDTLWDGAECLHSSTCCSDTTQPWFYRQLSQTTQNDIEARICARLSFPYAASLVDQLELYIQ